MTSKSFRNEAGPRSKRRRRQTVQSARTHASSTGADGHRSRAITPPRASGPTPYRASPAASASVANRLLPERVPARRGWGDRRERRHVRESLGAAEPVAGDAIEDGALAEDHAVLVAHREAEVQLVERQRSPRADAPHRPGVGDDRRAAARERNSVAGGAAPPATGSGDRARTRAPRPRRSSATKRVRGGGARAAVHARGRRAW